MIDYRYRQKNKPRKKGLGIFLIFVLMISAGGYYLYQNNPFDVFGKEAGIEDEVEEEIERVVEKEERREDIKLNAESSLTVLVDGENPVLDIATASSFVSLNLNEITLSPTIADLGEHSFLITTDTEEITYNVTVDLPVVDFVALQTEIEGIIGSELSKYAVYVYDLKRGEGVEINAGEIKYPASISKIPFAILTLQNVDKGEITLDSTYPITAGYKAYSSDPMYHYANGYQATFADYLDNLAKESDNTAMMHLEYYLGGVTAYNQKVQNDLGLYLLRYPHETTAADVGMMLKGIYGQEYLSEEMNEYLLDLMFNTASRFDDRIVAGVSTFPEAKVAHKIGQIKTDYGMTYHDAGIVYGEYTDFMIVVLNEDVSVNSAKNKISEIAKLVYQTLN